MISREKVSEVRERTDLVDLISHYVSLKKAGRNHIGLCPFHGEKTPSFTVNREKGLFHCFGCGAGGDCFGFLIRQEGIGFIDAVRRLAEAIGVPIDENHRAAISYSFKESLFEINGLVASFYRSMLFDAEIGATARAYLRDRGLKRASLERFGLGYAPPGGEILGAFLKQREIPMDSALQLGIVSKRGSGKMLDLFRNRVVFPIQNESGKIVGFGGRALDPAAPKYLNSPSSPLYNKGETLYGLFQARDAIRSRDRVVLVEGYMDAIQVSQAGLGEVVGALGTSVTVQHLQKVRRLASKAIAMFDGDSAGEKAALRALEISLDAGLSVDVCFLPDGEDPDSFSHREGSDGLEKLIEKCKPLLDFYLDRLKKRAGSPSGRARSAHEMAQLIKKVQDPIERDFTVQRTAEVLEVREELLRSEVSKPARALPPRFLDTRKEAGLIPVAERTIVEWMIRRPELISIVGRSGVLELFEDAEWKEIGCQVAKLAEGPLTEGKTLLSILPEETQEKVSGLLIGDEKLDCSPEVYVEDCIRRVKMTSLQKREEALRKQLREAEKEGSPFVDDVLREWTQVKAEQRGLIQSR